MACKFCALAHGGINSNGELVEACPGRNFVEDRQECPEGRSYVPLGYHPSFASMSYTARREAAEAFAQTAVNNAPLQLQGKLSMAKQQIQKRATGIQAIADQLQQTTEIFKDAGLELDGLPLTLARMDAMNQIINLLSAPEIASMIKAGANVVYESDGSLTQTENLIPQVAIAISRGATFELDPEGKFEWGIIQKRVYFKTGFFDRLLQKHGAEHSVEILDVEMGPEVAKCVVEVKWTEGGKRQRKLYEKVDKSTTPPSDSRIVVPIKGAGRDSAETKAIRRALRNLVRRLTRLEFPSDFQDDDAIDAESEPVTSEPVDENETTEEKIGRLENEFLESIAGCKTPGDVETEMGKVEATVCLQTDKGLPALQRIKEAGRKRWKETGGKSGKPEA